MCASCNSGAEGESYQRPHGVFDTELAGEGIGLLVDRPQILSERWLAGSIPGWTYNINGNSSPAALYQPRYLSDSGRLFFNSSDALSAQDENGKEDVYQYEPQGVGSCHDSGGCTGLISSGTSGRESAFLDASQNGEDVFFLTAAPLVAADTDQAIDIYDAHVCSSASPCIRYPEGSSAQCESASECRPSSIGPPPAGAPASATFSGPGNPLATPQQTVAANKASGKPPKRLTRAQKLARALKSCRKRHRHAKKRRKSCERQARKKYAKHKHKAKKKAGKKKGKQKGGGQMTGAGPQTRAGVRGSAGAGAGAGEPGAGERALAALLARGAYEPAAGRGRPDRRSPPTRSATSASAAPPRRSRSPTRCPAGCGWMKPVK